MQHSGRLQSLHRELGSAGVDDRGGDRDHSGAWQGTSPGSEATRIISDNGPQFIAKDFKEFIRVSGMTHVRTSPYYPQSNGKIERWHKSLKGECIRPGTPLSLEDARRLVKGYVEHYNDVRLSSAIGYITPRDCSPAVSRRSMLGEIGSWRRLENSVRFAGSRVSRKGSIR